jgi:adenylyl-sulfate kinase
MAGCDRTKEFLRFGLNSRRHNQIIPKQLIHMQDKQRDSRPPARSRQYGLVIWLTGLSGAGKSTIAYRLQSILTKGGRQVCLLDGDVVRRNLCSDLGFTAADRKENIRRVAEVARLMADTGVICIVALISPYDADRQQARALVKQGRFVEIFINAPLAVCEARDPKGHYARARAGRLKQFTGISSPYEAPKDPEIELPTDQMTIRKSVGQILEYLKTRHRLII